MLKKNSLYSFLLVAVFLHFVNAEDLGGFSNPESVFLSKDSVFVSNLGQKLEPLAKDNDGFISKLDKNGKILELKFLTNLNAPKGMNEIDGVLYVVDIDVLKGFDIKTKKEVLSIPIKDSVFLNDIAVLNKDTLLVSDTGTGLIHRVNLVSKAYDTFAKLEISKFGGPNGLLLDAKANRLIVVGYDPNGKAKGSVVAFDLKTKKMTTIVRELGALDGVVFAKNGDLLVSDWGENLQGCIWRIDLNGKANKLELESMGGPADMSTDGEFLWIPRMADNKITKLKLP